jgi:hypothetical protein
MERQQPRDGGDFQDARIIEHEDQARHLAEREQPEPEHPTDAHLIHYNITEALREARPIDHATARVTGIRTAQGRADASAGTDAE